MDKVYCFLLSWLVLYQVYKMNYLIFIKHVVWIEKRCNLNVISDDQYSIPTMSLWCVMTIYMKVLFSKLPLDLCLPAENILRSTMNLSCSQIKIGFMQLYCDIREDFYITGTLSLTICSACLGFTVSTLCNTITVTKATDSSHTNS